MSWVIAVAAVVGTTCSRSENGNLFRLVIALDGSMDHYNIKNSNRLMRVSTNSFNSNVNNDYMHTGNIFSSQSSPSLKCFDSYKYSNRKIRDCFCYEFYQKNHCKKDGNGEGTSYRPKHLKWDKVCAACCCLRRKWSCTKYITVFMIPQRLPWHGATTNLKSFFSPCPYTANLFV